MCNINLSFHQHFCLGSLDEALRFSPSHSANGLTSGCNVYTFFFLCPCVAFLHFFCLVLFVLFLFSCLLSLSISPLSHCYLAEVLISTERKKTSASTDLATSCFFAPRLSRATFLSKIFHGQVCTRTTLTLHCFHAVLFFFVFFCYWLGLCVLQVTNPSSILPLRGWRLAISIPTPPLRLPTLPI